MITLALPKRHWVDIQEDVNPVHLKKVVLKTYEANPQSYRLGALKRLAEWG